MKSIIVIITIAVNQHTVGGESTKQLGKCIKHNRCQNTSAKISHTTKNYIYQNGDGHVVVKNRNLQHGKVVGIKYTCYTGNCSGNSKCKQLDSLLR